MAEAAPRAADMFGDTSDSVQIAERFESFKDELNKSLASPVPAPGQPGMEQSGIASLQKALGSADVTKALSPEVVESVRNALADSSLNKDWTTTNPLSSGLVAFDLEAPRV